jgi:hypothetical protein
MLHILYHGRLLQIHFAGENSVGIASVFLKSLKILLEHQFPLSINRGTLIAIRDEKAVSSGKCGKIISLGCLDK